MPYKDKEVEQEYRKQSYEKNRNNIQSTHHPIYRSWAQAKRKKQLCNEWLDRSVFTEWALSHGWEKGLVIWRKDTEQPFSPDNCSYCKKQQAQQMAGKIRHMEEAPVPGGTDSPLYRCWLSLKSRQLQAICEEWLNYDNFYEWAMANKWQKGCRIRRHDKHKQFCPENCYYPEYKPKQDIANKVINFKEKQVTIKELADDPECKVSYDTLCARIRYGVKPELLLQEEIIPDKWTRVNKQITAFGETKTAKEWGNDPRCKVGYSKFSSRVFKCDVNPEIAMQFEGHLNYRKSKCQLNNEEIIERCKTFLHGSFAVINNFGDFVFTKGIYGIFNTVSGLLYVGQAAGKRGVDQRLARHQRMLEDNVHDNIHLQSAWDKYGETAFAFILLEDLTTQSNAKITEREKYWIEHYKTKDNNFGYNITDPEKTRLGIFTSPYSLHVIKEWIKKWIVEFGKPPTVGSGTIPYDERKRTWSAVQNALLIGNGGLPGGMCLKEITCDVLGKPYAKKIIPDGITTLSKGIHYDSDKQRFVVRTDQGKIGFTDHQEAEKALVMLKSGSSVQDVRQHFHKHSQNTKVTLDFAKIAFAEEGMELLATEYINSYTPMPYICSCGNKSKITWDSFKAGHRCQKCAIAKRVNKIKHSLESARKIFADGGGELLANTFDGCHVKMPYICSCGNKAEITLSHFQNGQRCKKCKNAKSGSSQRLAFEFVRDSLAADGYKLIAPEYINSATLMPCITPDGKQVMISWNNFQQGRYKKYPTPSPCQTPQPDQSQSLSYDRKD